MSNQFSHFTDKQTVHLTNKGFKILGDMWTLQIINTLRDGQKRYSEIEKSLPDSNPKTLSNRLKNLTEHNFIQRIKLEKEFSVSYRLTEKGVDVLVIIDEIERLMVKYS